MSEESWASPRLADRFVDEAYATVKGHVRTHVMHQHLLAHLPPAPAALLDVGGGAGNQSFPLARLGYEVTLLDPSPAMLDKARGRLARLPEEVRARVTLVEADGHDAEAAVGGRRFAGVLCHGVLGYLDDPEPLVDELCARVAPGGVLSIMTGNARASVVQPALERRWADALASFDARTGIGVLGVRGRADTVDELGALIESRGVGVEAWYGVWLFVDWLEFSGVTLDVDDAEQVEAIAAVELEASRRDPYRQLSRVFHLVGRRPSSRDALLADREATRARLDALSTDLERLIDAAAGANLDDEHDPEGATVAFEREQLAALRARAVEHLDEIETALARITAGDYGTCQSCGGPIGDERLAARPFARQCVACAKSGSATRPR